MIRREDEDGFTLLEERVLRAVDLDALDRAIDGVEARAEFSPPSRPWDRDPNTYRMATYRVIDAEGAPVEPTFVEGRSGPQFEPRGLDGDRLRGCMLRFRRLDDA